MPSSSSSGLPVLLALGFMAMLAPTLGAFRLLSLDESSYASIAASAAFDGAWWPLVWKGQVWFEKPPLLAWAQALSLRWAGHPSEWAVRWPALLASALSLALCARWAAKLSRSAWVGALCALLLGVQLHTLLFARCGTLDALFTLASLLCLHALMSAVEAGRPPYAAAAWALLAAALKTWFALAWLLPALLLLSLHRSASWTRRHSVLLALPSCAFILIWLLLGRTLGGARALDWELAVNLGSRLGAGAWKDLLAGQLPMQPYFYGSLTERGAAGLWVFLPWSTAVCFGPGAKPLALSERLLWATGLGWLVMITLLIGPSINYFLPLLPWAALLLALAWGRRAMEGALALWICVALSVLASWGSLRGPALWLTPWVPAILAWLPATRRLGFPARPSLGLALAVLLACVPASIYIRKPPEQNRLLVSEALAVLGALRGQELTWVGDFADSQVVEFYTRARVRQVAALDAQDKGWALTRDPRTGGLLVLQRPRVGS